MKIEFKQLAMLIIAAVIGGVILNGAFSGPRREKAKDYSGLVAKPSETINHYPYPSDEGSFVSSVTAFADYYKQAPNELKKSSFRIRRSGAIKLALDEKGKFSGWVGRLVSMKTTSDGKAYLSIRIAQGIHLRTRNNGLSDHQDKTLIDPSDPLFAVLSDLKEGDIVHFSGEFFPSKQDFIKETSLLEQSSMVNPEFLIRLTSIRQ